MATSGTDTFVSTFDQIIIDAFAELTVYGEGETVSAHDMAYARRTLNRMLKAWQADGLHLWTKTEGVLFFTQYKNKYQLGSTAYAAEADDVKTRQLTVNHVATETVLTLDSTIGIMPNDNIGIVLDNNSLYWTVVDTITSLTQLVIVGGLPSLTYKNNLIFAYTKGITKPSRVYENARLVHGYDKGYYSDATEIPISMMSYKDYMMLPVKSISGGSQPVEYTFNPNVADSSLYLWPPPNNCSYRLYFTYERKIEDMINTNDTLDLPIEWEECVLYQLKVRMATKYGREDILQVLLPIASSMLDKLKDWDNETLGIDIFPGYYPCNYQ